MLVFFMPSGDATLEALAGTYDAHVTADTMHVTRSDAGACAGGGQNM